MKTVQRIMAIETNILGAVNDDARISNSCMNKLCCNPEHLIKQTQTEVLNRRYARLGTGGIFDGKQKEIRAEYRVMKEKKIPNTIGVMAEKYNIHPSAIYRAIKKANEND